MCAGLNVLISAKVPRRLSSLQTLDDVFLGQRECTEETGSMDPINVKLWVKENILFQNVSLDKAITQICKTYPCYIAIDHPFDVVISFLAADLQIPDSLCKLLGLRSLCIRGCYGVIHFPAQFSKLPNFRALTLMNAQSTKEVPVEIFDFTRLNYLSLTGRPQSNTLPSKIGNLVNLQKLVLELALEHLPEGIRHLKLLTSLFLRNNRLEDLPSWIGELKLLDTLILRENRLYELPAEICECESLTCLNVRDNRLRSLPYRMGDLKKLRLLDLGYNVQLGRLPITLGRVVSKHEYDPVVILTETRITETKTCWRDGPIYVEGISIDADIERHLRMNGSLESAILCGLADWKTVDSPWSRFLCRGLYDPRLFLHVAAWAGMSEFLDCFDTSENDELARKRKLEPVDVPEVVILE
jgi:hypothetical protein